MSRKKAIIEVGEKELTFEFDRTTIIYTEKVLGFNLGAMAQGKQLHTESYNIWCGGLQKNHAELSIEERMDLKDQYTLEGGDLAEINDFLIELYTDFSETTQQDTPKKKARFL